MLKKIMTLLLVSVITFVSVPFNVFTVAADGVESIAADLLPYDDAVTEDSEKPCEDIYYSDLFYGYDTSYLKSAKVMNYSKDTYDITTDILIDYGNSPACIITGGYTALSLSPKELVGLLSEALNTNYTYNQALDAANVKLLEQLADKDTSAKFGTAQSIIKGVRSLADLTKEYRDGQYPVDHFKDMSDEDKFKTLMNDIAKNDLIIKIDNSKFNQIVATVANDIEKYIDLISITADVIDLTDVVCTAIIMESARLELVDYILKAAPYDSVLYDGMSRLRKQLDDGFVNFLLTHYLMGNVIDKLAELIWDKAFESSIKFGYVIAQIFTEVLFGSLLDVPSLHEVMLQSVLTSYSKDMYGVLFDSEQGIYKTRFNKEFDVDDIAEFECVFNAYTAATEASLEVSEKLTLGSNRDRFDECVNTWYKFNYETYMLDIVEYLGIIPPEERQHKYFDMWTVNTETQILPASDILEKGNIYMFKDAFRGNVTVSSKLNVPKESSAVIDGNVLGNYSSEINLNGELEITGKLELKYVSTYVSKSYGRLNMTEENSVLKLGGDFTSGYPDYCCDLTAGTIVFNGIEQQTVIGLEAYNIEVTNPKGIKYGGTLYLHGNYQLNGKPLDVNGCYTYWLEGATFSEGSDYSNVYIPSGVSVKLDYPLMANVKNYGTLEISDNMFAELRGTLDNYNKVILYGDGDVRIDGDVTNYENGIIEVPASSRAKIDGNVTVSYSGELNVNGELEITGGLELKFASSYVSKSYGKLNMTEKDSVLRIGGDFGIGNASYCCNLTSGTVVFNGNSLQKSSGFKPIGLTLENTSDEGVVFTSNLVVYGLFDHKGNNFTLFNNGKGSYFIDFDGDGVNDHLDPEPTLGPYTVPVVSVDNYVVTMTAAIHIRDIRYAPGVYSTPSEIKAAEGNVALSNDIIKANTRTGQFKYEMPDGGYYTFWVRMTDGREYFLETDMTKFVPKVSTYGVKITVDGLYDAKDFFIAKGEFNSYNEIKSNGYIVRVTPAKIADKHNYTYTVKEPGIHTVLVRYNNGTEYIFHEELTIDEPVFTTNGLQVTVSNIPDVKVIRTAYGEYNTPGDTKRASGARNFSNKAVIKDAEEYMLQYREEGRVTIIVEYNNGYVKVFHYDVTKKVPAMEQDGNTVTFGELDGLVMIRYAMGEYATSSEIKKASGSKVIKPDAVVDGKITVTDLAAGTYTFCVQFDDESYNYYKVVVE